MIERGHVVLVDGAIWDVFAARHGLVWLTSSAPWRALLIVPACRCKRVPGVFVAPSPWEIN